MSGRQDSRNGGTWSWTSGDECQSKLKERIEWMSVLNVVEMTCEMTQIFGDSCVFCLTFGLHFGVEVNLWHIVSPVLRLERGIDEIKCRRASKGLTQLCM